MNDKSQPSPDPAELAVKDKLYASNHGEVTSFVFDQRVAAVFDDMIRRSVPGYAMTLEMISVITRLYARPNTRCYDLGCSLGASTLAIRQHLPFDDCTIIAVDSSAAMIEQCRQNIALAQSATESPMLAPVECRCEDITTTPITRASLVTLNFTLQFIAPQHRLALLSKIAEGTIEGGALVLSEKIAMPDANAQHLLTDLHHAFKASRGYSELEIAQKRTALEDVLIPETLQDHRSRLLQAGFRQVEVWFQCFNFASLIAVK